MCTLALNLIIRPFFPLITSFQCQALLDSNSGTALESLENWRHEILSTLIPDQDRILLILSTLFIMLNRKDEAIILCSRVERNSEKTKWSALLQKQLISLYIDKNDLQQAENQLNVLKRIQNSPDMASFELEYILKLKQNK